MRNKYELPAFVWKRWSRRAKKVFNRTYKMVKNDQAIFLHLETHPLHRVEWETIAYNVAYIAACACDGIKPKIEVL